jgi:hypothetical protein
MLAVGLAAAGTSAVAAPQTSGGIKFMVLYGHPPNPAEFEKYYPNTWPQCSARLKE